MVGAGTSNSDRRNLFSVTADGNAHISGAVYTTGFADFGEYFESASGEAIPVGTSVIFDMSSRKIRAALPHESPIGVISDTAAYIGNAAEEEWVGKYERDTSGKIILEEVSKTLEVPIMTNKEVDVIVNRLDLSKEPAELHQVVSKKTISVPETIRVDLYDPQGSFVAQTEVTRTQKITQREFRRKLSPLYDPDRSYLPRSTRKEWHVVGLIGVVKILPGQPVQPHWVSIMKEGDYQLYLIK
jgi:hypothetical protein